MRTSARTLLLFLIVATLGSANVSAASKVKVFVFAGASGHAKVPVDGFIDPSPSADPSLTDSVQDLHWAIRAYFSGIVTGVLENVSAREDATIVVQVVGREEVNGAYVVHARATFKDHQFDLTGGSTHQWKESAHQIAIQLAEWVRAHRARIEKS
jgi:hypothetical protein